ncbi:peptide chain release factor N(5)-glutamine methyltransferase [bacterium]|nr:peptide chain release factor N(5)-glutamine methyltransferase [bacterium]
MYRKPYIDAYLKYNFPFDEAKAEVDFALDTLFNYTYKDFMLGKTLKDWQISKLWKVIKERVTTHKPIQQIIGMAYFCGRKFFVDDSTLVPRPETEILVKDVLEISKEIENPNILDIGTGSGCIPITLMLENKFISADSVDISLNAIEMAKKNALFHNILNNLNIFKSDLFENINKSYNIIVSNPPYIPLKDKETLQTEVKDFEPANALFTNDELGIEYYKKIIEQAENYLTENGYIAFELGINQIEAVASIFKQNNYKVINIDKDLNSIERVIIARK